jgi:hypothetical protein
MIRIVISNASSVSGESEWYTTLTVTDRLEALAGRLFGTFGGIVGTGGLAAPFAASLAFPPLAPVFVVGWLGGVYGATRYLYRKSAHARGRILQHIFAFLVDELERLLQ